MALVSVLWCAQWLTQHNSHPHPLRFFKVIDKFTCTCFCDHGVHGAIQGPRIWNSLPAELQAPDISQAVFRNR